MTSLNNIGERNITAIMAREIMVFVLDTKKQPQPMIHPAEARKLLRDGKAAVFRKAPFTIILSEEGPVPDRTYRLKIDYGSKHTGLAILDGSRVLWLGQIDHRTNIKDALDKRRGYRRRRRSANLRYRKPRFTHRQRQDGWLPPSLLSRVDNVKTVVRRLQKLAPVGTLSYENVKFDTQLIQDEMISGVRYQQGELAGYEVREYLLEKFKHQCAYCGMSGVPLEVEHIIPKSRGGTNRISNLAIACHTCNQKKGSMTAAEFGHAEVQAQAKAPLRDAALVTATRWAVFRMLQQTGLPVECGSGGRTKYNRIRLGLPKDHCYDACCVGASTPERLHIKTQDLFLIRAVGRGKHQRTNVNASGFPRGYLARQKMFFGFKTGDCVVANVTEGRKAGIYQGTVLCRRTGSFDIRTSSGRIQGIGHKWFRRLQHADGYSYFTERRVAASSPCLKPGASAAQ